jgi:hypothetical protein
VDVDPGDPPARRGGDAHHQWDAAHEAAIQSDHEAHGTAIAIRKVPYRTTTLNKTLGP